MDKTQAGLKKHRAQSASVLVMIRVSPERAAGEGRLRMAALRMV
jgi:hypothetical protein